MDWRNACRKLQEKGIKFENVSVNGNIWYEGPWEFKNDRKDYRISAQPIPDIPGWRELCREMQSNDVLFSHQNSDGIWVKSHFHEFAANEVRDRYQIPQQPIPEWREDMNEETKPDQREEIPHRDLQIQWHEDKLHSLRTGEPMREWEFRFKVAKEKSGWLKFGSSEIPAWDDGEEYRRKPRTVTYWHCVVIDNTGVPHVKGTAESRDALERVLKIYDQKKVSPITETTVELED